MKKPLLPTIVSLWIVQGIPSGPFAGEQTGKPAGPATPPPPRIAVVSMSDVFKALERKKDIEGRLKAEIDLLKPKIQELKLGIQQLQEELKNIRAGTDAHRELTLKIADQEYRLKGLERGLLGQFEEKRRAALNDLQDEIAEEIRKHAGEHGIDLVLEKKIVAGPGGEEDSLSWPLVHWVKPELEITDEIVRRLNAAYGKTAPPRPAGEKSGEKAGESPSPGGRSGPKT